MRLIVKADDYGSTEKVCEGILYAMKKGVVTDTSFLVNSPHFDYAVKRAKEEGITAMGLHLALTYRGPILPASEVASLVNGDGNFYPYPGQVNPDFKIEELEKEWRAQIEKFKSSGFTLTHLDSHHHVHAVLDDKVGALKIKLAKELGVPMRRPKESQIPLMNDLGVETTDIFFSEFGGRADNSSIPFLLDFLKKHEGFVGSIEIMTHPGYSDQELRSLSSWNDCREIEIATLTSLEVLEYIKKRGIELISFSQL